MTLNVGSRDRVARYLIALAAFGSGLFFENWAGLIGLVPLVTAFAGWCPFYRLMDLDTCPRPDGQPGSRSNVTNV